MQFIQIQIIPVKMKTLIDPMKIFPEIENVLREDDDSEGIHQKTDLHFTKRT